MVSLVLTGGDGEEGGIIKDSADSARLQVVLIGRRGSGVFGTDDSLEGLGTRGFLWGSP